MIMRTGPLKGYPATRGALLNRIEQARASLDMTLMPINDVQMLLPKAVGVWSIKDGMVIIIYWEQHAITTLRNAARGLPPAALNQPGEMPAAMIARINAEEIAKTQSLTLSEVQDRFYRSYQALLACLSQIDSHALLHPQGLARILGYAPVQLIASDTYEHYEEQESQITSWYEHRAIY
jgi:Protein of unknown function (DUF1706)